MRKRKCKYIYNLRCFGNISVTCLQNLDESLRWKFPFLCKYVSAITNNIDYVPDADNSMEKSENDSSKSQLQAVVIK